MKVPVHKDLTIIKPRYWLAVGFFLLHQLLQYVFGISIPLADAYLDPFLAPIVVLGAWEYERFLLLGAREKPKIHPIEMASVTLYIAMLGEFLFPFLSQQFYYDPLDFIAYGLGGVVYSYCFHSKR